MVSHNPDSASAESVEQIVYEDLARRVREEVAKATLAHDEGHGKWTAVDSKGEKYQGEQPADALTELANAWSDKLLHPPTEPVPVPAEVPAAHGDEHHESE